MVRVCNICFQVIFKTTSTISRWTVPNIEVDEFISDVGVTKLKKLFSFSLDSLVTKWLSLSSEAEKINSLEFKNAQNRIGYENKTISK